MIFAVLDPSPLTVCINCSFLHLLSVIFIILSFRKDSCNYKPRAYSDLCVKYRRQYTPYFPSYVRLKGFRQQKCLSRSLKDSGNGALP